MISAAALRLKRRNRAFMKLTPKQRRVAIAKEVLKWVPKGGKGRFVAIHGTYVDLAQACVPKGRDVKKGLDLGIKLEKASVKNPCYGCAKGAFFVARVAKFDGFSCSQMVPNESYAGAEACEEACREEFPSDMFDAMERAFENFGFFEKTYHNPNDRIRAIAQNIIRNRGDFSVAKEMDWLKAKERKDKARKKKAAAAKRAARKAVNRPVRKPTRRVRRAR